MNLLSARSIILIVGFVMLMVVGALVATLIDLEATLRGVDPLYQGIVVVAIAVAPVVVAFALVHRRRVNRLDAAAGLVLWGLLIVLLEHVQFGRAGFGGADLLRHSGFHFQMLAAYGLAALALVGVVVAPLIRRGGRRRMVRPPRPRRDRRWCRGRDRRGHNATRRAASLLDRGAVPVGLSGGVGDGAWPVV